MWLTLVWVGCWVCVCWLDFAGLVGLSWFAWSVLLLKLCCGRFCFPMWVHVGGCWVLSELLFRFVLLSVYVVLLMRT